ncbi:hypothetical protein MLD38_010516 [Melastoma candidum]|uniref:Uncharacterized protein n=1 Tax=Melastoma candidum TaxID=119954 RepID=A0ACB9QZQ0_9MYRT|nr:hypothetical protein MLD38_010516 [Melastoma candidum]
MGFSWSNFLRQEPSPSPLLTSRSCRLLPPPLLRRRNLRPSLHRPGLPPPPLPPPPGPYPYCQCSPHSYPPPHYAHCYNAGPRNYGCGYSSGGYNARPGGPGTSGMRPRPARVPFVEQKQAKLVINEVNVHKDSIRVTVNENGTSHLVSFTFDALVDGRHGIGNFTIFYFAKEGANCIFSPVYPKIHTPRRFPFLKGVGQRFYQPPEAGIDLGFFYIEELVKPSSNEEVSPLVICAKTSKSSLIDDPSGKTSSTMSSNSQITQAVLERDNQGHFQAREVKQILWNEGVRYELLEICGISSGSSNAEEAGYEDNDPRKECVICMTEPKDTVVVPCRYMCMCSKCAKNLRLQSKCPICCQLIQGLIEIEVK